MEKKKDRQSSSKVMQKVRVRKGLKDIYFIDKKRKEREKERCDSERDQKFRRRAYIHRKKIKNK